MDDIAIDWGRRKSRVSVRSADGKLVESRRVRTAQLSEYLSQRPPSRVIVCCRRWPGVPLILAGAVGAVGLCWWACQF